MAVIRVLVLVSRVPSPLSHTAPFLQSQTSRLRVGGPGWDTPAEPQLPGSSLSPSRKPPCCSSLSRINLTAVASTSFPFSPDPGGPCLLTDSGNWGPSPQPARLASLVYHCLPAQGMAFPQLLPSSPQLSTPNAWGGIVGGVCSRPCGSSRLKHGSLRVSLTVQLRENKV